MLHSTPIIISLIIILSAIIGGVIGHLVSRSKSDDIENPDSNHTFHVDSSTGIVSDVT
ncbi:MAG: hypothetical protein GXO60_03665 [Epsilonproteobacteria bacterium]|nr:hypothetical protein [Campylobacterota bacterium]